MRTFAQAEYYYDGDEPREDWLWHMGWKARLRRFRLPSEAPDLLAEGCSLAVGGDLCTSLSDPDDGTMEIIH